MKKKILLILAIPLGLTKTTQAQNTYPIEGKWVNENYPNTMYILDNGVKYTYYCTSGNCDSLYNTFQAGDSNAMPGTNPYTFANDTLTTDLHFGNIAVQPVEFQCGGNIVSFSSQGPNRWIKLNTNLNNCNMVMCDLLYYTPYQSPNFFVLVNGMPVIHYVDSMQWNWQACNSTVCYPGYGSYVIFPNILTTDTVKLCYDVYLYFADATLNEVCNHCDSLIFNQTTLTWEILNSGSITSINEFTPETINNNKIYDLLGRELTEVPVGSMYIRNQKLYITKK